MKNSNFEAICLLEGTHFLDSLNKSDAQIKVRDITLSLAKKNKSVEIKSRFEANNEVEAGAYFKDAIETLKYIITYCTRRTPLVHGFNICNLDKSQGYSDLDCCLEVVNPIALPDINDVLTNINIIVQSVHLENAFHYYRLANLSDDNKESILNLYKCVESIIGFPKGNDKFFKQALKKINLDCYLNEFKGLRTLRNKFDSAHSAGGKNDGSNSYKDIEILNKEVEDGKDLIQRLIKETINYLSLDNTNTIAEVFIRD